MVSQGAPWLTVLGVGPELPAALDHLQPAEVGHLQVGQHHVEGVLLQPRDARLAARGDRAGVAAALQALGDGFRQVLVVIDDEDVKRLGRRGHGTPRGGDAVNVRDA